MTVSFSIGIKGIVYGFFKGRRGQRDPLSPLLFRLCLEVFSRAMKGISVQSAFHHHPMCVDNGIIHLAYVDDLLIFARDDESTKGLITDCVEPFGSTSGMQPNLKKSNLYLAGVDERTKIRLL